MSDLPKEVDKMRKEFLLDNLIDAIFMVAVSCGLLFISYLILFKGE